VGVLFVFFSSRRRHTRLVSDWSSDVCSSDLMTRSTPLMLACALVSVSPIATPLPPLLASSSGGPLRAKMSPACMTRSAGKTTKRSEERRVGERGRRGGEAASVKRKETVEEEV